MSLPTPYAPYSGYEVRARVTTVDGQSFSGCNMENVNYSLTIHAEQAAMVAAYLGAQPEERAFIKMVEIWTKDGGMPCGGCRQALHEFAAPGCVVVTYDEHGRWNRHLLEDLLPFAFGPESLGM